ncbi:protein kinase [Sorangium cellulosum]|uniref:Protein kinase n=1 Tax=Sorangium cellulosum TaxID=56 RepID=A0A2L0F8R9_SORCE|nr:AAA family ATPase [Sorangium cellulosum]AUX47960.1 protein kinase [Sorangium cellulosum]
MIVSSDYRHVQEIERSEHWTRYRALRAADDAPVELKALRTDPARMADTARLKHEYARIAQIDSTRLVKVLGVEEHEQGVTLVLAGLRGRDLGALLSTRGRLGAPEFLGFAIAMTEALRDLHQHDVLHRAVRPSSFIIDGAGEVRLTEYGVDAQVTREEEAIYSPAVLAGRLPYLSPEQTGRMNRGVDHRADLYSLGVVFYEMLTGKRPFTSHDALELIHAHIAAVPEAPAQVEPSVPAALSDLTMKLLRKDAEDRYQSAGGLLDDLVECQARLRRDGHIQGFIAGQHDRTAALQIHQKLYGRDDDIRRLNASFQATLRGGRNIVLVSGYSGVGKSSLVHEILRPLARERGYFVSGKYDQFNRDKPHGAIAQAFEGLLRQILSEPEARLESWRTALRQALGNNARVLCDVIPSLRHLVGDPPPVPELGPIEAQNRLNLTFQRFVSVFARSAHPLALFLDDLQWIDSASLILLGTLLGGEPLESLFFCGAYRDNEVSPGHPLFTALRELEGAGIGCEHIVLSPLGLPQLAELVRDCVGRERGDDEVEALAALVLKRTGGNPFFVKKLIQSTHRAGALRFDRGRGWSWDLDAIASLEQSSDAVDLMVSAIRRLPPETQRVLTLASAIGNRFDLSTLCTVLECSADEAYARLEPALREGLLASDGAGHRFVHDRIQEAAYSLISGGERAALHHRIGTLLLSTVGAGGVERLFDVVNHMNSAGDLVTGPGARLALARMNLQAAEAAEAAAAFDAALRYAVQGIDRLPPDAWSSEYELTFTLTTKKALMDSVAGRHGDAIDTLSGCFERARSRLDQTRIRRLKINVLMLQNDLAAALTEGVAAIGAFGVELAKSPGDDEVTAELDATMQLVAGRPIEALCELSRVTDPDMSALQEVLQELFLPCYFISPNNYAITVMKVVQNTLKHGIANSSMYAFVNFGVFLCARGDVEVGYQFGRAAMRLNQRYPDKRAEPMLFNTWGCSVQHWKDGYPTYKQTLLSGLHVSMETGQHIWAFYNGLNANTNSLLAGRNLGHVLAESRSLQPLIRLDRWKLATWMIGAVAQVCHNLTSPTPEPARLAGEWIEVDKIVEEARRMGNHASVFFARFYAIFLALFQGAAREAAALADETSAEAMGIASWHGTPCFHFYGGIALALAADAEGPGARERYLAKARAAAERLSRWAQHGPENLRHRHLLLSAELAAHEGDPSAGARYDEAIAAARGGNYLHDQALANELCARHHLRCGKTTIARGYALEAYAAYARWGATAVLERLDRDHPELLGRDLFLYGKPGAAPPQAHREGAAREGVDLRSVLKASEALAGEIVLPRLLEKLMCIILESAGARRGFLILKEDTRLTIEAEGHVEGARVELLQSQPLGARADLSSNVVRYVARTKESIVVGDASAEAWLADDPHLKASGTRSLLVAPLLHQGRTLGVIYLENDLAAFAFTEDRVELLRLLSSHAAVSIENARLFGQLEDKVEARTAELRAANEQITMLHAAREREQEQQMKETLKLIERQRELIHELSAPVIRVWDDVLAVPVVGALDDERAAEIMSALLDAVTGDSARFAIIDLTGVGVIDARTADHLLKLARAIELIGARAVITGVRPAVAKAMVSLDVSVGCLRLHASLREGLRACMRELPRGR